MIGKTYLGDGVYADVENGMLKLTTENGIAVTNTIYLGPRELAAMHEFITVYGAQAERERKRAEATYEVVVGNIGTVYRGTDQDEAGRRFRSYVQDSRNGYGRVAGEPVTLFKDGEIVEEIEGTVDRG